jgi:hypothetical protein
VRLNSTSHWLHGDGAARETIDIAHTSVGYATHHASAVFWARPFEAWLGPAFSSTELFAKARPD